MVTGWAIVNRTLRARFNRRRTFAIKAIASCIALTTVNLISRSSVSVVVISSDIRKSDIPNRIVHKLSQVDIRPRQEVLSPGLDQCTHREGAGHRTQSSSYHGERGAGEPVAARVEMSIVVVNAFGLHVALSVVLLGALVLFAVVEILSMLVDVVTTVGHHLDEGVVRREKAPLLRGGGGKGSE